MAILNAALESDTLPIVALKLNRGQGIICNNVLHSRSEFYDADNRSAKRCLHRIRYGGRVLQEDLQL